MKTPSSENLCPFCKKREKAEYKHKCNKHLIEKFGKYMKHCNEADCSKAYHRKQSRDRMKKRYAKEKASGF